MILSQIHIIKIELILHPRVDARRKLYIVTDGGTATDCSCISLSSPPSISIIFNLGFGSLQRLLTRVINHPNNALNFISISMSQIHEGRRRLEQQDLESSISIIQILQWHTKTHMQNCIEIQWNKTKRRQSVFYIYGTLQIVDTHYRELMRLQIFMVIRLWAPV